MCKSSEEQKFKIGQPVYINGEEFTIRKLGLKYFESNGDPDKLYALMENQTSGPYIITHDALERKAETGRPEARFSADDILAAHPCPEGLTALWLIMMGKNYTRAADGLTTYKMCKDVMQHPGLETKYSISDWVDKYYNIYTAQALPTSWLAFVAKMLKLLPKGSGMEDRQVLKRLLGADRGSRRK